MFKRCSQIFLFAGVLALIAAANATAANRPYAFTLTPQIGVMSFEGNQGLDPALMGGLALGYNFNGHWGAEGVLTFARSQEKVGGGDVDVTAAHIDLLYHLRQQKSLVPYASLAVGALELEEASGKKDGDILAGYGVGFKYFLSERMALRFDLKHLLDINFHDLQKSHEFYNMLSATAGLSLQFGGENMAQLLNDSDTDGIVDAYDRCPGSSPGALVDGTGCLLDADHDGVDDRKDRCPGTPAGDTVDAKGCPVAKDADLDGVVDAQDTCPNTPAKTAVDARGCPLQVALVAPAAELPEPAMTFYLEYLPNATDVSPEFAAEMQKMADFVKANPGRRFVIEGHTDSVGGDASNMRLSIARAEKIRDYLVEKLAVPASLLDARGFGESNPVADNATQEGRQQNRRVVIIALPQ